MFKPVNGYEGFYEVSSLGKVKSLPKMKLTQWGLRLTKERMLKVTTFHPQGYRFVTLIKEGKRKSHSVHRLVATAFIANINKFPQLNHKDTIKDNNIVDNLEWCTNSFNQLHAFKYGLQDNHGSNHPRAKTVEDEVLKIREIKAGYNLTNREIGQLFGLSKCNVQQIVSRATWTHL